MSADYELYGKEAFKSEVVEYVDKQFLTESERFWMSKLNHEYNKEPSKRNRWWG